MLFIDYHNSKSFFKGKNIIIKIKKQKYLIVQKFFVILRLKNFK